jgi:hypothetical protein
LLFAGGYSSIWWNESTLLAGAELCKWDARLRPLKQFIDSLALPAPDLGIRFSIALLSTWRFYRECKEEAKKSLFLTRMLESLSQIWGPQYVYHGVNYCVGLLRRKEPALVASISADISTWYQWVSMRSWSFSDERIVPQIPEGQ